METVKINRDYAELQHLDELGESALKSPKLMDLVVNGVTLMSVNKDTLRGIIRVLLTGAAAEVERLTAENAELKSERDDYIKIGEDYRKNLLATESERDTLKVKLEEEVSRRYQAECNYDHTVKDRDTLKKALKTAIHRGSPQSSEDTVKSIMAFLIKEAQEQEGKK